MRGQGEMGGTVNDNHVIMCVEQLFINIAKCQN